MERGGKGKGGNLNSQNTAKIKELYHTIKENGPLGGNLGTSPPSRVFKKRSENGKMHLVKRDKELSFQFQAGCLLGGCFLGS